MERRLVGVDRRDGVVLAGIGDELGPGGKSRQLPSHQPLIAAEHSPRDADGAQAGLEGELAVLGALLATRDRLAAHKLHPYRRRQASKTCIALL